MRRTVEEINSDIQDLMLERNRANAVTADGVPIEVGMTLYTWYGFGIEKVIVPENVEFREHSLHSFEPYIDEQYVECFTNPMLAANEALTRAERDVTNAEARLRGAREQLKRLQASISFELEEFSKAIDK